jgi:hypothetical protein
MKHLSNFILENTSLQPATKSFTFNFDDIEHAEETIKSIQDMGEEHNITVTVNGDSVTIVVDGTKLDDIDGIVDVLQQTIEIAGKSTRRSSNEQYAQKCQALERTMNDMMDYIDNANIEEIDDKDKDKNKEKDQTSVKESRNTNVQYDVCFIGTKDDDDIPYTVTISVEKQWQDYFENFLNKSEGDILERAYGGNVEY